MGDDALDGMGVSEVGNGVHKGKVEVGVEEDGELLCIWAEEGGGVAVVPLDGFVPFDVVEDGLVDDRPGGACVHDGTDVDARVWVSADEDIDPWGLLTVH